MRHTRFVALVCLALVSIGSAPPSGSAGSVSAFLDGQQIDARRVGDYFCHDFDYPLIRCYRSGAALGHAVADRLRIPGQDPAGSTPESATSVTYVRIFADAGYGGASMYISAAYDQLGDIGWNDRISSFITMTSAGGTFWQHIYATGWAYPFCCLQGVTYVGDSRNDQFSSVYPN